MYGPTIVAAYDYDPEKGRIVTKDYNFYTVDESEMEFSSLNSSENLGSITF